jgi:hypothetical protein
MNTVGPVLEAGEVADAIVAAIRERHPDAVVHDRGSYVRVLVADRCELDRESLEAALGRPFSFPSDLELVMPSFKGRLRVSPDGAEWSFGAPIGGPRLQVVRR